MRTCSLCIPLHTILVIGFIHFHAISAQNHGVSNGHDPQTNQHGDPQNAAPQSKVQHSDEDNVTADFEEITYSPYIRNHSSAHHHPHHHEHDVHHYSVAKFDFKSVQGPLIVSLWLLFACIAKIGKLLGQCKHGLLICTEFLCFPCKT